MPAAALALPLKKQNFGTSRRRLSDQGTPPTSVRGRGPGVISYLRTLALEMTRSADFVAKVVDGFRAE